MPSAASRGIPKASARDIAREWARRRSPPTPRVVKAIVDIMMRSREAVVNYMTPLGLHHIMDTGHHHGPGPWVSDLTRPEWNPTYYHRADRDGIGFDRTATRQQCDRAVRARSREAHSPIRAPRPTKFLLWFHHLPWDYKMPSGRTLWAELVAHYDRGVAAAADLRKRWEPAEGRHRSRAAMRKSRTLLVVQEREAQWWRDACIAYFQSVSGLLHAAGHEGAAAHASSEYKSRRLSLRARARLAPDAHCDNSSALVDKPNCRTTYTPAWLRYQNQRASGVNATNRVAPGRQGGE